MADELTRSIYSQYKTHILDTIAYIEVYNHDVVDKTYSALQDLFTRIAEYELETTEKMKYAEALKDSYNYAEQYLYFCAIHLFFIRVKELKKLYHRYNYKGVTDKTDRTRKFYQIAKEKERKIGLEYRNLMNEFYRKFWNSSDVEITLSDFFRFWISWLRLHNSSCINSKRELFFPLDKFPTINGEKTINLKSVYEDAKDLLQQYESCFPNVISNGTSKNRCTEIGTVFFSFILPVILAIPFICQLLDWLNRSFPWLGLR